ncbi:MAG: polyphosphate--glucose phosphotransferase [Planctomycetota bacterium]
MGKPPNKILGIDIGGSGIKGAIIDTDSGALSSDRLRVDTPGEATPRNMGEAIATLVENFRWRGPIGCGFPGVVKAGVIHTSSNVDDSWQGVHFPDLLHELTGCQAAVLNDADAAGLAEMRFGAGRDRSGTVIMITVGTGLGTAFFTDGRLWPNTEIGHVQVDGVDAEEIASDRARKTMGWKRRDWAGHLNRFLQELHRLLWPDLFIVGGGASKKWDKFADLLHPGAPVVPAHLLNHAGMIGAAVHAQQVVEAAASPPA